MTPDVTVNGSIGVERLLLWLPRPADCGAGCAVKNAFPCGMGARDPRPLPPPRPPRPCDGRRGCCCCGWVDVDVTVSGTTPPTLIFFAGLRGLNFPA